MTPREMQKPSFSQCAKAESVCRKFPLWLYLPGYLLTTVSLWRMLCQRELNLYLQFIYNLYILTPCLAVYNNFASPVKCIRHSCRVSGDLAFSIRELSQPISNFSAHHRVCVCLFSLPSLLSSGLYLEPCPVTDNHIKSSLMFISAAKLLFCARDFMCPS